MRSNAKYVQSWYVPFKIGHNLVIFSYIFMNLGRIKEKGTYLCITVHSIKHIHAFFQNELTKMS